MDVAATGVGGGSPNECGAAAEYSNVGRTNVGDIGAGGADVW